MQRPVLTTEAFLAALAVLSVGCSKKAAPSAQAEPPTVAADTTAAPSAAPVPAPATPPAPEPMATAAASAPAEPAPSAQSKRAAAPRPISATPLQQPAADPRPGGSAGCGASGCSPDMKKGHLNANPKSDPVKQTK